MRTLVTLPCDANDHILKVECFEDLEVDPLYYFNIYIDAYYAGQISIFRKLKERANIIWHVLRGREYLFEEIVVTKEHAQELRKLFDE